MQNCLFTFVLCLVPSAWLIYFYQDFSIERGFVLYTLCLAALLTSIVRLWLHNLELISFANLNNFLSFFLHFCCYTANKGRKIHHE